MHDWKDWVTTEANWLMGGLDDDGNPQCIPPGWEVHQNSSGYNNHVLPLFIFLDRHDSHWCPYALQLLKDNTIHVFFLRSQNSTHDQPNDNGSNTTVKSIYMRMLGEVQAWMNPLEDC